jgi:antitoxin CcdA
MDKLYDLTAAKKATNLSINSDLLNKSKALRINLSATLEQALQDKLAAIKAEKWAKSNQQAISVYNNFIEEHGGFGDEYRKF